MAGSKGRGPILEIMIREGPTQIILNRDQKVLLTKGHSIDPEVGTQLSRLSTSEELRQVGKIRR